MAYFVLVTLAGLGFLLIFSAFTPLPLIPLTGSALLTAIGVYGLWMEYHDRTRA